MFIINVGVRYNKNTNTIIIDPNKMKEGESIIIPEYQGHFEKIVITKTEEGYEVLPIKFAAKKMQLKELEELFKEGHITRKEYEKKRKKIARRL